MLLSLFTCLNILGQEDYVLETRFRNPVDTTNFHDSPTILLFVHSKCSHGYSCATSQMQKAMEEDSLQIREERGIKLYVVYPKYNEEDIKVFDSHNPILSEVIFYTDTKYRGSFSDGNLTPFVVFMMGKGIYTKKKEDVMKICMN